MATAEDRLDGAIAYRALVRYDAYNEMSGHQSTTIALLDADHNGVVLSSIAHRDTARMYCKQVHAGRGEQQLSPEEEEAVRLALAGEVGSVILEQTLRAAYLGPPGTVSDEALTAAAPELEGVPLASLRDVVLAVQEGRVERALAPVENALEGGVDPVLDALALEAHDVALVGEVVQPVSYCLAAGRELALDGDHDGALAPAGARPVHALARRSTCRARPPCPAASTADAVREVAAGPRRARAPRSARGSPPAATAR